MEAVIIPTYNEGENIENIVLSIFTYLPKAYVIVVDDNSPDGTAEIVEKLRKKHKNLYVIKRKGKGGRGSAVIEGLAYALKNTKADKFLEMDADFSHDPSELPQIVRLSKPDTVMIGSRYIKGSKIVNWPFFRKTTSRMSNLMIKSLLRTPIVDNTNGYRCYPRKAAEILVQHQFISKGYIVLSESTYLLFKKGFKFVEVKSIFVNRKIGKSKASVMEFADSLVNVVKILNLKIEKETL